MTIDVLTFLYLSLGIGFLILVYYIVTLIKRVHETLDRVDYILENVKNTSEGIESITNKAKGTFFNVASMVLGLAFGKKK